MQIRCDWHVHTHRWPAGFGDHLASLGFTEKDFWPGPEA